MYSNEDLNFDTIDLLDLLVMAPFIGLCAPFILVAYKIGIISKLTGWSDT